MDSEDFYLVGEDRNNKQISDIKKLRKDLTTIFPAAITLKGFYLSERRESRENPGIISTIMSIFSMASSSNDDTDDDENSLASCNLKIQSFVVRPLRRFHRSITAFYTPKQHKLDNVTYPKIVVLKGGDDESAIELLHEVAQEADNSKSAATSSTQLELNTVIIGPFDKSLMGEMDEELDLEEILPAEKNAYIKQISSSVAPSTWIVFTVFLVLIITALAFITSINVKKVDAVDKENLIMSSMLVNSTHAKVAAGGQKA